ncbi:unnamed protein product, partial [Urochloa humidicola]
CSVSVPLPPHRPTPPTIALPLLAAAAVSTAAACGDGCPLAVAAYYFTAESNLTFIASLFNLPDPRLRRAAPQQPPTPNITDPNCIVSSARVSVPFRCSCLALPADLASTFHAGPISHDLSRGETYGGVAAEFANRLPADKSPASGTIDTTVNCSCGDKRVSPRYVPHLPALERGDAHLGGGAVHVLVAGVDGPAQEIQMVATAPEIRYWHTSKLF